MRLPCAGQGRQPLPSRSDACVTSYWVLPDVEIGSKAAFSQAELWEKMKGNDYSFEKIEQLYYFEHYADHIQAQSERNEKTRHTERNRTVNDLLINNKTCPEESVYQIGIIDESVSGEVLARIATEFFAEMEEKFGSHVHILDWALHLDEGTSHIHERHVFDCEKTKPKKRNSFLNGRIMRR